MENYFYGCSDLTEVLHKFKQLAVRYGQNGGDNSAEYNKLFQDFYEILKEDSKFALLSIQGKLKDDIMQFPNLVAGALLPELNLEFCGSWLWVTGNTFEYKEKLKELGNRYSSNKKCWYWRPYGEQRSKVTKPTSMEYIRDKYGSDLEEAS